MPVNKTKYVGVDLSKAEMVVDVAAKPRVLANDASGYAALIAVLPAGAHVVCESTGGYQRGLVSVLQRAQVPVSVVMPGRVRHFAKARGLRAKTDPIDARLLSAFGEAMRLAQPPPRSEAQLEFQQLWRARQVLVGQLNEEDSLREHCTVALLQEQAKARRELLRRQMREIEQQLRIRIAADEAMRTRVERMSAVDGVGEVTAWAALSEMPELGRLERGQAAALLGVAPDPQDSGPRKGRRRIGGGRSMARKVFYMAALTAAKRNRVLRTFYERLVTQHHKPKLVALTAVMRKLIELLNRLLADPEFILAT